MEIFFSPLFLSAQKSFYGSISLSAMVQPVVTFTLNSNSSPTITFSNGSDYVMGYTVSNFNTTRSDKEVVFDVLIQNTGNSPDVFKVTLETELRLARNGLSKYYNARISSAPGKKVSVSY